jgi:hypothetical protein
MFAPPFSAIDSLQEYSQLFKRLRAVLHLQDRWQEGTFTCTLLPHQGREIIAIGALENGAFCTVFSENFHKF